MQLSCVVEIEKLPAGLQRAAQYAVAGQRMPRMVGEERLEHSWKSSALLPDLSALVVAASVVVVVVVVAVADDVVFEVATVVSSVLVVLDPAS